MARTYKIGTRASRLALKQVREVTDKLSRVYSDFVFEVAKFETYGDRDKKTPIAEIEGSDFFTRQIDKALLEEGGIDFAVHSAKDLPDNLREGIEVAAVTDSICRYDVLVSKNNLNLDELAQGACIGTSSQRRKNQLKNYRSDFKIVDMRGNVPRRLEILKSKDSKLDAIVIAAAGLIRLEREDEITQKLPFDIVQTHPLQGALALVVKKGDKELKDFLRVLDKNYKKGESNDC